MRLRVLNIPDVVESQLCTGCGVCASIDPVGLRMVDDLDVGRRPIATGATGDPARAREAFDACPGAALTHEPDDAQDELVRSLRAEWGPVREVWEGWASDPEIRRAGSSGGAATALALYGLEQGAMHGVLHIASRPEAPILNHTVLSRSRAELLGAAGSRYAPASPCDSLARIEDAPGPCVFIGKPCDAAAVQRARRARPALDEKLGLVIAFFCAGTPSTKATLELLKSKGVQDPRHVRDLRYRGDGWPGLWRARVEDERGASRDISLTYEESWDFLQRYRQWRCYICPDHTGEFADIAVGDPWYRPIEEGEPGSSLLVARTARGVEYLRRAAEAGHVHLECEDASLLPRSQPNLLKTRGRLWGQLVGLRLAGAAVPQFEGFSLARAWRRRLSLREKARSILGTIRRAKRKRLRSRLEIHPLDSSQAGVGGRAA